MFKQILVFMMIWALPPTAKAHATGGVSCRTDDGRAEISIGLHRIIIYSPMSAYARLDTKKWKSVPVDGEVELGSSQGILSETKLQVEFADSDALKIIIRLNVNLTGKETENGYPGTLIFQDGVKRVVFCLFE